MKKLLITLTVLMTVFSLKAQSPKIYIGEKGKGVEVMSSLYIDSAAYFGIRDTSFTPYRKATVVFQPSDNRFYYWDGTWWYTFIASTIGQNHEDSVVVKSPLKVRVKVLPGEYDTVYIKQVSNIDTGYVAPHQKVDSVKIRDGGTIMTFSDGDSTNVGTVAVTNTSSITWGVLDSLSSPPAANEGDVYLVGTSPTGAFVGHANNLANYDGASYTFDTASIGDLLYNAATLQVSKWTGTVWLRVSINDVVHITRKETVVGIKTFADTLFTGAKGVMVIGTPNGSVSLLAGGSKASKIPWFNITGNSSGSKLLLGANNAPGSRADMMRVIADYTDTIWTGTYRPLVVDAYDYLKLRGGRVGSSDTVVSIVTGNSNLFNYLAYWNANGTFNLPKYGTGARTGTTAYNLAVTSLGKVIEVAPVTPTNFANTDLTATANRIHTWANYSFELNTATKASYIIDTFRIRRNDRLSGIVGNLYNAANGTVDGVTILMSRGDTSSTGWYYRGFNLNDFGSINKKIYAYEFGAGTNGLAVDRRPEPVKNDSLMISLDSTLSLANGTYSILFTISSGANIIPIAAKVSLYDKYLGTVTQLGIRRPNDTVRYTFALDANAASRHMRFTLKLDYEVSPNKFIWEDADSARTTVPTYIVTMHADTIKRMPMLKINGVGPDINGNYTVAGGWGLNGNAGTTPGTDFIGTTDFKSLVFKTSGVEAGWIQVSSDANTTFGRNGIPITATGYHNTVFGADALHSGSGSSVDNTVMGYQALQNNSIGQLNTAIGSGVMLANTSGYANTVVGGAALASNISGHDNSGIGYEILYNNTGNANIGLGNYAGFYNTSGSNQLFINGLNRTNYGGDTTLSIIYGQQTGSANTQRLKINAVLHLPVGAAAGYQLTSDATGLSSWQAPNSWNLTGNAGTTAGTNYVGTNDATPLVFKVNFNTVGKLGIPWSGSVTDINCPIAFGIDAYNPSSTGYGVIAIGGNSFYTNNSIAQSVGIGRSSVKLATSGYNLIAIGDLAMSITTSPANDNTAIGANALSRVTGVGNTVVGSLSAQSLTSGVSNTIIGQNSVTNTFATGSRNTFLGANITAGAAVSDAIAIGNAAVAGSNQMVIGSTTTQINRIILNGTLGNYANNAAAITGGLAVGDFYRNGDVLMIVH